MENNEKKKAEELLLTLHSQFSENQNHHQKIFIQLFIALFALFGVLGYVFINTASINQFSFEDSTEIKGYSDAILFVTSLLISFVLLSLNAIIIQSGYAFRRDECIMYNIRQSFLGKDEYKLIFRGSIENEENEEKAYDPYSKSFLNYLPDFHYIIFLVLLAFQIIISIACLCVFILIESTESNIGLVFILFTISTIFLSCTLYDYYFSKYAKLRDNKVKMTCHPCKAPSK